MAAPPPPFPPTVSPPQVPQGWAADWSAQYNTWYYTNSTTGVTQWEPPVAPTQAPPPPGPPPQPHGAPPQQQQQYSSPPQLEGANGAEGAEGPDGERGLGKVIVGGGLLALAGTMIHSAMKKHEPENGNPQKSKLDFFKGGSSAPVVGAVSGFFAGKASSPPAPSYQIPPPPADYSTPPPANYSTPPPPANYSTPSIPNYASPPPVGYPTPPATAPPAGGFFGGIIGHGSPATSPSGEPILHIHCAAYADRDVTQVVRRLVTPGQSLEFDTDKLVDLFGDPWPGNRKQFSIIYSYGQRPWELVASADFSGTWSIIPHQPLDKNRMEYIVQDPGVRLVALVWGKQNGLKEGKGQAEKVKEIETTGEFEASNSNIGFDGMCGPPKNAIAYYRAPNGQIAFASARENGTLRMPWNPLSKWT